MSQRAQHGTGFQVVNYGTVNVTNQQFDSNSIQQMSALPPMEAADEEEEK